MYSVYQITIPGGMVYVGKTKSPKRRLTRNGYIAHPEITEKFDVSDIVIVFSDLSDDVARLIEALLIRHYKSLGVSLNIHENLSVFESIPKMDKYALHDTEITLPMNSALLKRFQELCRLRGEKVTDNLIAHIKSQLKEK